MNDTVTLLTAADPAQVVPPPPVAGDIPVAPNPTPKPDCESDPVAAVCDRRQPPLFPQAKGESARAAEAFRAYLELGPRRRYAAVGRKVGASPRTVKRWANDFDWRGRIKTYAAQSTEQYIETENTVQREDLLDAAARAKAFRDRQYTLAEAMLDAAERYLERVDDDDLDQMSFTDACKALEVASRIGQQAASSATDDPAASSRTLRDQLASLLDQAYGEAQTPNGAGDKPQSATPTQVQP
jgi:hypothetical protein